MTNKRKTPPRNIHTIPVEITGPEGTIILPYTGPLIVSPNPKNKLDPEKVGQDEFEVEEIRLAFSNLGPIRNIPKEKHRKTPDLELEFEGMKIPIEVKFIEAANVKNLVEKACIQIEEYTGDEKALGIVCLIYRHYVICPRPIEGCTEANIAFFRMAGTIIKDRRIIILIFPHLGCGYWEYFDSSRHAGNFKNEIDSLTKWISRMDKLDRMP
jgi:hypothetical protein